MRHHARRQTVGVALFPFLAVLICTMGALIVLLVLLMQQATRRCQHKSPSSAWRRRTRPIATRLREQLEDAQWRRELLEKSRAEKTQELAGKRDELAHLEDHIQRLESQAKELLERAKTIDEGQAASRDRTWQRRGRSWQAAG